MKHSTLKNTFLLALLAAGVVFLSNTQSAQNQHVYESHESCTNHVDMLMTSTWQKIKDATGFTAEDCQEYLNEHLEEIKKAFEANNARIAEKFGPVSEETRTFIEGILIELHINPKDLPIIKYEAENFLAGVDDFALFYSEENMKAYSSESQRFILAHELTHYKHKDQTIETALNKLLDINDETHVQCLHSFTRATEYRADILAMLRGANYTNGAMEFFNIYMAHYGDFNSATHPGPAERLSIAQDIHTMHLNAIT